MPSKPEAKHCPFCRSLDLSVEHYSTGRDEVFYVNCTACGADGPAADSRGEAVTLWNRRPGGDGHA